MARLRATAPASLLPGEAEGRQCLGPCRQCGALVLGCLYRAGVFVAQEPPLTPVLGQPHRCEAIAAPTEAPRATMLCV